MRTTDKQSAKVVDTQELRKILHELANLFTAILITSGLLQMKSGDAECCERYSRELLETGERGAVLVREARSILIPPEERIKSGGRVTVHGDASHAEQPANQPAKSVPRGRARAAHVRARPHEHCVNAIHSYPDPSNLSGGF